MPFPFQLLGNVGDLLRVPGMKLPRSARTPSTFPGRPSLPRSLSDSPYPDQPADQVPAPTQPAKAPSGWSDPTFDAANPSPTQSLTKPPDPSGGNARGVSADDMLKNPDAWMTPGERAAAAEMQQPVQQAHGLRHAAGTILGGLAAGGNWQWLNPAVERIQHPGIAARQARIEADANLGALQRQAVERGASLQNIELQRQEAQQRLTDAQQRAKDAALNAQRTSYDRRMKDIESVGGFEAPEVPPSIYNSMPMSPLLTRPNKATGTPDDSTSAVRNLPMRNLILSPGLQASQSARLGTVESVTDPDTQVTRNMVRPNAGTRQEIQQGGWPKVTPEMATTLSDLGLEAGTPVPQTTYNKLVQAMQTRQTQAQKPGPRPISVAPGHRLVDDSGNVIYAAPGKPDADQKPPARSQFAAIETRKQTALAKAEQDARKRLRGSNTAEPEDPDSVYADLGTQKQQIQDAYEQEISALTGNDIGHFDYSTAPPTTSAGSTRSARSANASSGPTAGPQTTVSEAQLRRQAAAAGKDPDAAVQIAKRRGYRLIQ